MTVRQAKRKFCSGYYSFTHENPTSAVNDGEFTKDVFITPFEAHNHSSKGDAENAGSVQVTIQGQDEINAYNLETFEGNQTSGECRLITTQFHIYTISMSMLLIEVLGSLRKFF